MNNTNTTTINVSRKFCEDHEERDCEMPVVVKTMKTLVTIEVDPDHPGWKDLKSDADYYGSLTSEECWYDPSFPATARAVKAKMLAAEAALNG